MIGAVKSAGGRCRRADHGTPPLGDEDLREGNAFRWRSGDEDAARGWEAVGLSRMLDDPRSKELVRELAQLNPQDPRAGLFESP